MVGPTDEGKNMSQLITETKSKTSKKGTQSKFAAIMNDLSARRPWRHNDCWRWPPRNRAGGTAPQAGAEIPLPLAGVLNSRDGAPATPAPHFFSKICVGAAVAWRAD